MIIGFAFNTNTHTPGERRRGLSVGEEREGRGVVHGYWP